MARGRMSTVGRVAAGAALVLAACKGERVSHERLGRSRDAAAVVLVDRPSGSGGGSAAAVATFDLPAEREPNARAADASPLGAGVQGVLDGETDVDAYLVTSAGPRMLTAALTALPGIDTRLELRDKDFAVLYTSDRGGAGVAEGLADAPLDKGTYYLVVREVARPVPKAKAKPKGKAAGSGAGSDAAAPTGRVGRSPAYGLTVKVVEDPAPGGEREPDDDRGAANDVTLIEPVTGHLGWQGDVDVWKLSLEGLADGNGLDLAVSAIDGTTLTLAVTDAADRPRVAVTGQPGQPLTLRSVAPRLDPGEAPVHYLKVGGKPANPDVAYSLTVTARLLDLDEEAEPNDKPELATALRYGAETEGTMRGRLGAGEVDVFALSPSSGPRVLDAAVDGLAGLDLVCEVLVAPARSVGRSDGGGVGASESASGQVPAGAAAYVRVTAKASKKPVAPVDYTVRWTSSSSAAVSDEDPLPPEE